MGLLLPIPYRGSLVRGFSCFACQDFIEYRKKSFSLLLLAAGVKKMTKKYADSLEKLLSCFLQPPLPLMKYCDTK
jgi:hypothetical protein